MAGNKKNNNLPVKSGSYGFGKAFVSGNAVTKLSALVFGLGNILHKQIIRGLLYLALECAYVVYMINFGIGAIRDLFTLGTKVQEEVFNEAKQVYEYVVGDNSMLCLLYGVVTIFVTLLFLLILTSSVKSAYETQLNIKQGKKIPTFIDDLKALKHEKLQATLLFFPITGVLVFSIVPLVFNILIAFTNYDRNHQTPGNLFDWVGLANFTEMFKSGGILANTFWPVLQWTFIWAIFSTVTCYFLGLLLAIVINREGTRFKGFWRFIFVLSIALPQFVSLLTMRTIFNTNGPVNVILRKLELIDITASVPFFTDPTIAKITIICINIWIGVPFTMLNTTGILNNIPKDLYEAAKVDGANAFVTFFKITMPYMLFIMTPTLITAFVGNINNFNVIFLLSGGGPESIEYYTAGKTDLLVTWLYKLTLTNKDYNLGAVIGIIVFVIMATLSLLVYRKTSSYKDEEAFQ
ncbi:MAG: Fructose-bisphosphate aldolase [Lachnospiraceae bacterium]|jgi:arabinogalactan oligomer/maltooligosaccharide transport system permease protein|nr:Fructose-bisphosphate aldolase [Lachnospiraceae bacterium]MDF2845176.1 Fructose-bisphosphate aldolase [Herbinix sp.]